MNINHCEAESYIRKCAKKAGLTFKKSNTRLTGAFLWRLVDRKTGEIVMRNYQFWSAYSDACSGYIESYDGKTFYVDAYKLECFERDNS